MIVRPVRDAEWNDLGDLTVAAYRAIVGAPSVDDYEHELRDVGARVKAGAEVVVAVTDDDEVAGGVTFVPDRDNPFAEFDDPDAAGFRMLAVSPAHQGSGAGSLLTGWCVERARVLGRARIVIHSTKWMTTAHGIYERKGFARATALDWEPMPDFLLMAFVKELS